MLCRLVCDRGIILCRKTGLATFLEDLYWGWPREFKLDSRLPLLAKLLHGLLSYKIYNDDCLALKKFFLIIK